jgi:hypothetical protein
MSEYFSPPLILAIGNKQCCWGLLIILVTMKDFIFLFSRMTCHLKCFETVNETVPKNT